MDDTYWPQILGLYDLLDKAAPNPMTTQNRAVAVAEFSGGRVNFAGAKFSGAGVNFFLAKFSGAMVDFAGAKISGGTVGFGYAEFSGGTVNFTSAKFSGAEVNFSRSKFRPGGVRVPVVFRRVVCRLVRTGRVGGSGRRVRWCRLGRGLALLRRGWRG
jgi:uncharacterized protein YjbI with pentapeptide repeats